MFHAQVEMIIISNSNEWNSVISQQEALQQLTLILSSVWGHAEDTTSHTTI